MRKWMLPILSSVQKCQKWLKATWQYLAGVLQYQVRYSPTIKHDSRKFHMPTPIQRCFAALGYVSSSSWVVVWIYSNLQNSTPKGSLNLSICRIKSPPWLNNYNTSLSIWTCQNTYTHTEIKIQRKHPLGIEVMGLRTSFWPTIQKSPRLSQKQSMRHTWG